jgi:hypothetical protein
VGVVIAEQLDLEPALAALEARLVGLSGRVRFGDDRDIVMEALFHVRRRRWALRNAVSVARPNAKLNWEAVYTIRASREPAAALARRFGVDQTTVCNVRAGRAWTERAA